MDSQRELVQRSLASTHNPDVFPLHRSRPPAVYRDERSLAMMVVQAHDGQPDSVVDLYVLAARTMVGTSEPPRAA